MEEEKKRELEAEVSGEIKELVIYLKKHGI